ncbi:MAG TPA: hypothetical protein PLN21_04545 [Gemmatales bacterium]|nr:hypothetical protein [Gemmatales bacterium]
MMQLIVWLIALSLGFSITYALTTWTDACSSLAAGGIVLGSFLISRFFKVAGRHTVSKMGTAWLTQELRQMGWRVALSLILAGLAYKLAYPEWGVAFWLCIAIYYQVGLMLHLRDIQLKASQATNTIEKA